MDRTLARASATAAAVLPSAPRNTGGSSVTVDAPAGTVWHMVADPDEKTASNPGLLATCGTFDEGGRFAMTITTGGERSITLHPCGPGQGARTLLARPDRRAAAPGRDPLLSPTARG